MEDGSIDKRTILKTDLKEIAWEDTYWIDLALDRDRRWAAMNSAVNCHVAYSGRAHTGLMWLWTGTGTGCGLP